MEGSGLNFRSLVGLFIPVVILLGIVCIQNYNVYSNTTYEEYLSKGVASMDIVEEDMTKHYTGLSYGFGMTVDGKVGNGFVYTPKTEVVKERKLNISFDDGSVNSVKLSKGDNSTVSFGGKPYMLLGDNILVVDDVEGVTKPTLKKYKSTTNYSTLSDKWFRGGKKHTKVSEYKYSVLFVPSGYLDCLTSDSILGKIY